MTDFPNSIYSPRTRANRAGVSYDPAKQTVLFAEDLEKGDNEIISLETELGTTPAEKSLGRAVAYIIDGGGSAITTGVKGFLLVPFKCEIQQVTLLADVSGDIVIDIWKDVYANFPPTDADSITAAAPPTLDGAQNSQDSTLTGWTKTINAGDVLAFNVDSAATITRVTLILKCKRVA